jgi:hypothetical protein
VLLPVLTEFPGRRRFAVAENVLDPGALYLALSTMTTVG